MSAFRLLSRTTVANRSAKDCLGFLGVRVGGFQGFFKDTSDAFFPRSIPNRTLCGEVWTGAGGGATCQS